MINKEDLVYRLRKRAEIRRQIPDRKSVKEGTPDRIADLLEEAANKIALNEIKQQEIIQECARAVQTFVDFRIPASEYPDLIRKYFKLDK